MSNQLFLLTTILLASSLSQAASIEGKWKTIDDKTNEPRSIVQIKKSGDSYIGIIEELLPSSPSQICDKCSGKDKNRPLVGMTILTGLKKINDTDYEKGKIFDPESGNTYSGSAKLINNGNKLSLRGYIGIKLIGRSQIWQRVQ